MSIIELDDDHRRRVVDNVCSAKITIINLIYEL